MAPRTPDELVAMTPFFQEHFNMCSVCPRLEPDAKAIYAAPAQAPTRDEPDDSVTSW
jgi:hypothetical protein